MKPYLIDTDRRMIPVMLVKRTQSQYLQTADDFQRGQSSWENDATGGVDSRYSFCVEWQRPIQLPARQVLQSLTSREHSHSWFVGYSNVDNPELVVAVIVENGGAGSEAAVPIAGQVFDAYYAILQ